MPEMEQKRVEINESISSHDLSDEESDESEQPAPNLKLKNQMTEKDKIAQKKIIDSIWRKYDADNSGELDFYESRKYIRDSIGYIPDQVFKKIFKEFDKDGSGAIGKEEMVDFMKMFEDNGESQEALEAQIKKLERRTPSQKKISFRSATKLNKQFTRSFTSKKTLSKKQLEKENPGQKIKLLKLKMKQ